MVKKSTKKKKPFDLHTFLIAQLRLASNKLRKYHLVPTYDDVLAKARVTYGKYRCADCSDSFDRQNVQIDHISPVVPVTGFDTWDGYIHRLFVGTDGLQILCKSCHENKSAIENKERRKHAKR